MCGIWAIFGSEVEVYKHIGCAMQIAHRGPDAFRVENVPEFNNCCLGFHRLVIVGNVFGMQPLKIQQFPNLCLLYNGEIYNYEKVGDAFNFRYETNLDGEAILHLYARAGVEYAASMCDGVFAFCIVDTATRSRKVHIARDTYGVKPMFALLKDDGFLAICSEAKGLLGLMHGCDDSEVTINQFPPGHAQSFNLLPSGKVSPLERIQYTTVGQTPKWASVEGSVQPVDEDIHANIRTLFEEAVRKRLMSARRIGCMLSGEFSKSST
ncbi:asparagine synthetase [glutamine-hydrolyzing]-like [Diadema antillarum]|uniref:asparagine synthetase [glutamine-hydrolyzing]-like n=1 Tax=Diadema antillarum TaxID=105358 RepID=UPI003A883E07